MDANVRPSEKWNWLLATNASFIGVAELLQWTKRLQGEQDWRAKALLILLAHKVHDEAPNVSLAQAMTCVSVAHDHFRACPLQAADLMLAITRVPEWQTNEADDKDVVRKIAEDVLTQTIKPLDEASHVGPRSERQTNTPAEQIFVGRDLRDAHWTAIFMRVLRRSYVYGCKPAYGRIPAIFHNVVHGGDDATRFEAAATLLSVVDVMDRNGEADAHEMDALIKQAHERGMPYLTQPQKAGWGVWAAVTICFLRVNRPYDAALVKLVHHLFVAAKSCNEGAMYFLRVLLVQLQRQVQAWWPLLYKKMADGDVAAACALAVWHDHKRRSTVVRSLFDAMARERAGAAGDAARRALEQLLVRCKVRLYPDPLKIRIPWSGQGLPPFILKPNQPDADVHVTLNGAEVCRVHSTVLRHSRLTPHWQNFDKWHKGKGGPAKLPLPPEVGASEAICMFEFLYTGRLELLRDTRKAVAAAICIYDAARFFDVVLLMRRCCHTMLSAVEKGHGEEEHVAAVCERACSDDVIDVEAWKQRKEPLLLHFVRQVLYHGRWPVGMTPQAWQHARELIMSRFK